MQSNDKETMTKMFTVIANIPDYHHSQYSLQQWHLPASSSCQDEPKVVSVFSAISSALSVDAFLSWKQHNAA